MTEPRQISFDSAPVQHDSDVHDREQVVDAVRWATVEYAPGAGRAGWCSEPHTGYVISGRLRYGFEDGRPPLELSAGDGFVLPPSPRHRGHNDGSEPARIFIVDALPSTV